MEIVGPLLQFLIPVMLILVGLLAGGAAERRHLRSLARREKSLSHMLVTNLKTFPGSADGAKNAAFVMGEVVIATDYLKTFLSALRKIVGGELRSYETLMTRARREALLRLLEDARASGYNAVCNVRYYSTDIGGGTRRKGAAMVEMFATGTAYSISKQQRPAAS